MNVTQFKPSGPVCTPHEARYLLESLRVAYLTLSPNERHLIKTFMSDLRARSEERKHTERS
jgi:hypothetical protein